VDLVNRVALTTRSTSGTDLAGGGASDRKPSDVWSAEVVCTE
jgi:hypothetical protein